MEDERRRYQETWDRALNLLSRREHSEQELKTKLVNKGEQANTVSQVVADLKQRDFLSDRRFTEMFVTSRIERGHGPMKIRRELCVRGVGENLIDQYMDQPDSIWQTALYKVWSKKFGEVIPNDYKEWAKQARFLHSRGFTSEQIRKVVSFQDQA